MRNRISVMNVILGFALALAASSAQAQAREEARLLEATQVLEELRATRDQFIPDRLLERAYGIAVVPNVAKVALFAGGRRGQGVLVVRDKDGNFTSPIFIALTGGSFGWQAGVQSSDIVLVFTTRAGIEGIADGKLTLGADASVAAGPVGRQASAATDTNFAAEVYSYSRSRGLFAGIALDGTALTISRKANINFYGPQGEAASSILNGAVRNETDASKRFLTAVAHSTNAAVGTQMASPAPATTPAASPSTAPAASPPPAASQPSGAAQSFPMEDPEPGQEPE